MIDGPPEPVNDPAPTPHPRARHVQRGRSLPMLSSPRRALNDDYVDQIFGLEGPFAATFPGYEPREGQIAMAREIDRAIVDDALLMVEAPTGTGKSIGYLVPAIRHAIAAGKKVVVCTANIALQEQLVMKDLPLLRELLPWSFTFALAKGRNNFACLDRLSEEKIFTSAAGARNHTEAEQWREILEWSETTETGDLSELPFVPSSNLKQRFTVGTDDCTGKACAHFEDCYANKAKERYKQADVVVANYHLFFSDLKIRIATEGNAGILPEYGVLICDEVHRAADIARQFMGFRVTQGSIRHAGRLLAPGNDKTPTIDVGLKERIASEADDYFARLRSYRRSKEYKARLARPNVVDSSELVSLLRQAADLYEAAMKDAALGQEAREKLRLGHRRTVTLADSIVAATTLWNAKGVAYYIEEQGDRVALCAQLIHVGAVLQEHLFSTRKAIVMTSATITVGGKFEYQAAELGCEDARELTVESPFDFERNAVLVVPGSDVMPDLSSKDFREKASFPAAAAAALVECVRMAEGRTLGLFTSHKGLQEAAQALRNSGWEGRILVQNDAPRTQLVREFREDVRSVLLGTESFWEGVDVPGEACSLVVIDKMPFPSPDDPVLDAVEASSPHGAFKTWSLPRAVIALRQGFGRLIRTRTDRGVVVVLDRRILEKPYGRAFTKSLPRVRVVRHLDEVERFLGLEVAP